MVTVTVTVFTVQVVRCTETTVAVIVVTVVVVHTMVVVMSITGGHVVIVTIAVMISREATMGGVHWSTTEVNNMVITVCSVHVVTVTVNLNMHIFTRVGFAPNVLVPASHIIIPARHIIIPARHIIMRIIGPQ
jgi:hypothetical protein